MLAGCTARGGKLLIVKHSVFCSGPKWAKFMALVNRTRLTLDVHKMFDEYKVGSNLEVTLLVFLF